MVVVFYANQRQMIPRAVICRENRSSRLSGSRKEGLILTNIPQKTDFSHSLTAFNDALLVKPYRFIINIFRQTYKV
jgi:hypothetical protein